MQMGKLIKKRYLVNIMKNKIKNLILQASTKKRIKIKDNQDLLSHEILDSFSIIVLISSIENEFKLKIDMKKFDLNKFRSLNQIYKLVKSNEKK